MKERLLKVEEVAVLLGCSVPTINNWYRFKKENPENELAHLIPDFIQNTTRTTRYWKTSDVYKLAEFRANAPRGRNGVMGNTTQKYYRKKGKNNGKEKISRK